MIKNGGSVHKKDFLINKLWKKGRLKKSRKYYSSTEEHLSKDKTGKCITISIIQFSVRNCSQTILTDIRHITCR